MKKKNKIFTILVIILFNIYLLIGMLIVKINDSKMQKIDDEIVSASKEVTIKRFTDNGSIEYPSPKTKIIKTFDNDENNFIKVINRCLDPYYHLKESKLIDADIKKLKTINKDTVGWIKIKGTDVSYPYVQTKDNNYYKNHSYYNSKNSVGWLFMDSSNSNNFEDKNTIIYANGNLKNTRFNTLRILPWSSWKKDDKSHLIDIVTEQESSSWQVVSMYTVPKKESTSKINFSKDEFDKFRKKIIKRSAYNFKAEISENDKLLTIVIKYTDHHNIFIHAKLIKKINKQL